MHNLFTESLKSNDILYCVYYIVYVSNILKSSKNF